MKIRLGKESFIYVAIFCFGWAYAAAFLHHKSIVPWEYWAFHAPAVSFGCGGPFAEPTTRIKELSDFLDKKVDTFDCAYLANAKFIEELTPFQAKTQYLDRYWGMIWLLTGDVTWTSIQTGMAAFAGLLLVITYATFRLALVAPLALALIVVAGPPSLQIIDYYRDYPNGVWMMTAIFFTCLLVVKELPLKRQLVVAGFAGGAIGLGLGFRISITTAMYFFVLSSIIFFANQGRIWEVIKKKSMILVAFFLAIIIVGFPCVKYYYSSSNDNTGANLVIGRALWHDDEMGLTKPFFRPYYQYTANDTLNSSLILMHADNTGMMPNNKKPGFQKKWEGAGEDKAAKDFYLKFYSVFPADFVVSAWSSIVHATMFSTYHINLHHDYLESWRRIFVPFTPGFLDTTRWLGPAAVSIALALILATNLRIGLFLTFLVTWFGAIPSLHYEVRHFYFLQFISLFAVGFLIQNFYTYGRPLIAKEGRKESSRLILHIMKRSLGYLILGVVLVMCVLTGFRALQNYNGNKFIEQYLAAPATIAKTRTEDIDGSAYARIKVYGVSDSKTINEKSGWYDIEWTLLSVNFDFSLPGCCDNGDCKRIPLTYDFDLTSGCCSSYNHSTAYNLKYRKDGRDTLFFPVINTSYNRFNGLTIPKNAQSCIASISQVETKSLPLLIDLVVPDDWRNKDKTMRFDFSNPSNSCLGGGGSGGKKSHDLSRAASYE